jgi:hypothetical protein
MLDLERCSTGFPVQENSCFQTEPFLRPGCKNNDECLSLVCNVRPECCSSEDGSYTQKCVEIALDVCEVPAPTNHCFEPGVDIPGCNQNECAELVCREENNQDCCRVPWTGACIAQARQHISVCTPPDPINQCDTTSLWGGCEDDRCMDIVCSADSKCCEDEETAGLWGSICVDLADNLCQPNILPRSQGDCPVGFTCDDNFMANCTGIRTTLRDTYEFGK